MVIDESRPLAVADLTQVDARLRWAQAELIMGNFEAVETILARGRKAMSDPRYQDVYLQLQLKKSTSTQDSELAMDAIERILAINPGHEQALNQLGRLLSKSKGGSTSRIIDLLANLESASDPALLVYQLLLGYHCHQ
jgi:tetratricopeptide (TPR) repeat protein